MRGDGSRPYVCRLLSSCQREANDERSSSESCRHIRQMASETMWMLIQSIEAYVEKNEKKAKGVILHDDIVDTLFAETKAELIELIHKDKNNGEQATDLLMVAKYFERIGDHATNIAEWVIFSIDKRPRG